MGARSEARPGPWTDPRLPERYRLVRRIGRGGMGLVWCAQDTVLERKVAVKLLSDLYLHDPAAVRRFAREARAAARLSGHPNVVTIFDVGHTPADAVEPAERPYIVMEHLPGGTVADAIRVHEVEREQALRWIAQAAAAIDYGHGRGVIHRDIKPSNMLLDGQHALHVADFGIARVASEETITSGSQLFGTAAYLSPEQALGRGASEASDRYALAIVAYELLTGARPFAAEQPAAQARQHVEEQAAPASARNRDLPRSVDAVLAQGLAKAPGERWGSGADFARALEQALASGSTLRHPRTAPTRRLEPQPAAAQATAPTSRVPLEGQPSGGRPRRAALAALLVAVAAVILIAALASGGGSGSSSTSSAARRANARSAAARTAAARASTTPNAPGAGTGTGPASSAPTSSSGSASALEAQGHDLMLSGDYGAAVGVLRQAVQAANPSSLTYAYALYDLGRALRLDGDPQAAVPVLERRLQIPNQTDVVRQELALAQAAAAGASPAGAAQAGSPQAPAGGPPGHGPKGNGGGPHGGKD